MKIGILGGTFNPIHLGHLIIAEEALNFHNLSKVIFMPVNQPPHKNAAGLTKSEHRYNMVKEAIKGLKHFDVSDIEINRKGKSFTIDTVRMVRKQLGGDCEIYLIIGADSVNELNTWKDIELLMEMCKFIVLNRPENGTADTMTFDKIMDKDKAIEMKKLMVGIPPIGISSTEIRKRLKTGGSVRFWTPPGVINYIRKHKLYL